MEHVRLRIRIATLLISIICSPPTQGQDTPSQKTVREKITTIRETTTTTRKSSSIDSQQETRRVAIFVKNRVGAEFSDKLGALEDLVTAKITDIGFRVMSSGDTLKSVRSFLGTKPDLRIPGAKLDELLDNNTSAVRLAQNMGVDYLIVVSNATFGQATRSVNRPDLGINRKVTTHKLRTVYKILDAGTGESISAGSILSSVRTQATPGYEESTDVKNDLLADASTKIAERLEAKGGTAGVAKLQKPINRVSFTIVCSMQDMSIPEIVKDEHGDYVLTANRYKLQAMDVTVELDGVVIGSAPGEFNALPGLHKIRLSREGFKDWERTVSITSDLPLRVALQLSTGGRSNWLDMAAYVERFKSGARLSEAQAKVLQGYAQMMKQSGVRTISRSDVHSDVSIHTNNKPTVKQTNPNQQNVAESIWP